MHTIARRNFLLAAGGVAPLAALAPRLLAQQEHQHTSDPVLAAIRGNLVQLYHDQNKRGTKPEHIRALAAHVRLLAATSAGRTSSTITLAQMQHVNRANMERDVSAILGDAVKLPPLPADPSQAASFVEFVQKRGLATVLTTTGRLLDRHADDFENGPRTSTVSLQDYDCNGVDRWLWSCMMQMSGGGGYDPCPDLNIVRNSLAYAMAIACAGFQPEICPELSIAWIAADASYWAAGCH